MPKTEYLFCCGKSRAFSGVDLLSWALPSSVRVEYGWVGKCSAPIDPRQVPSIRMGSVKRKRANNPNNIPLVYMDYSIAKHR
jgi:hypothetical protein